jgi:hypothetical protein
MKKVRYEEYVKKARAQYAPLRARVENTFVGRVPRGRPRDPLKEKLLTAMDKRRWERAIAEGRIQILGPRRTRIFVV